MQLSKFAWFGQVIEGTMPKCGDGGFQRRFSSQNDRFRFRAKRFRAFENFNAAETGHVQIDDHAVVGVPLQCRNGRESVWADRDLVA